jgi:penicillin-binding protein 1A
MMLALVMVLGVLVAGASAFWVLKVLPQSLPPVTAAENFAPSIGTKVYDDNDELITELHVERRIFVPLAKIPMALRDAVIATEDSRFYSHHGVDPTGIARAIYQNFRRGRLVEGGSTITQQLAKVLFLTPDKSLERKLKEALLALLIERRYSKDRILELYLDQIYFGNGAFGVEAAAQTFFGKSVSNLTLSESALLAGLPKAPTTYSPFDHPDAAKRLIRCGIGDVTDPPLERELDVMRQGGPLGLRNTEGGADVAHPRRAQYGRAAALEHKTKAGLRLATKARFGWSALHWKSLLR